MKIDVEIDLFWLVTPLFVLSSAWLLNALYCYFSVDWNLERKAATLHRDAFTMEDDDAVDPKTIGKQRITRLAVAHARTQLGLLSDTEANRRVVSETVRKFMREHGMRPTHISAWFSQAVEVYFLMSVDDRELSELRDTKFFRAWRRPGRKSG